MKSAPPAGGGTVPGKQGSVTQFRYDLADDVRNAKIQVDVDKDTASATRLDNAILVNGFQIAGGATFAINRYEWARDISANGGFKSPYFKPSTPLPRTATLAQLQAIADKQTAKELAALGPEPQGTNSLALLAQKSNGG